MANINFEKSTQEFQFFSHQNEFVFQFHFCLSLVKSPCIGMMLQISYLGFWGRPQKSEWVRLGHLKLPQLYVTALEKSFGIAEAQFSPPWHRKNSHYFLPDYERPSMGCALTRPGTMNSLIHEPVLLRGGVCWAWLFSCILDHLPLTHPSWLGRRNVNQEWIKARRGYQCTCRMSGFH